MKKKILVLAVLSFMITGVVSAANLWGAYKGNAIVKVKIENKDYKTSGVPPIILNGQVMIPLNVLKQLDVEYTWDSKKQTVSIVKPEKPVEPTGELNYSFEDAVHELGFIDSAYITVDARTLALDLLEVRKTKKVADYSVADALIDLGIKPGNIPTLATLRQAVRLIQLR